MHQSESSSIQKFRRSWKSVAPRILFALAVTALIFIFTVDTVFYGLPLAPGLDLPIALLVLGVMLVRPICQVLDCSYRVSDHHIESVTGKVSPRRKHVQLPFEDILGVACEQTILDRSLGVGDIKVWTAFEDRPEITMIGISNCDKIASFIRSNIDAARMRSAKVRHSSGNS